MTLGVIPDTSSHGAPWEWGARAAILVLGAAAWEGLARGLGSLMLPGPSTTLAAVARLARSGELWDALWVSNQSLLLGYLLAAVVGIPLGLILGRTPWLNAVAGVPLDIMLFTPMPAVLPLLIMAAGLGLVTRLLVVFLFAVAIVAVHATAGARGVDAHLVEMARAFDASRPQLFRRIVVPSALPAVLVGLRIGLSRAISGMIAIELLAIAVGTGRLIQRFQGDFDAPAVYAVVLVVVAEAVLLTGVVRRLEWCVARRRADVGLP